MTKGCALLFALLAACFIQAPGQQADAPDVQRLFIPGTDRALDLDLRGFQTPAVEEEAERVPDNDGRVREFIVLPKLVKGERPVYALMKIRVEPARAGGGAAALRDAALAQRLKLKEVDKGSVKQSEYKQAPLLRYKVDGARMYEGSFPSYSGLSTFPIPYGAGSLADRPISSRVLEAYLAQDGVWVTLSYMGRKFETEDEKIFYAVLDSAKFVDASRPSSSYDFFTLGSDLYKRKEHGAAVTALEKALALEQKQRGLAQEHWHQLVMTLANALGAEDEPERAREVLEYGVAAEPTYPYFHHGLSRLYSYFGDLDRVLASLEKAYEYAPRGRGFLSLLRGIPDPMLDPAFQKYKDDPKFRDAVKAFKKKYKD